MVSAITCTGDRPECLGLLKRWIKQQVVKVDQWLVIDDGKTPFAPSLDCDYIYRKPEPEETGQTLNLNMLAALPHIKGDIIIFMEDDEYYAPNYVEKICSLIQGKLAAGVCRSKYYHLPSMTYHIHGNIEHASLAQTAITQEALPILQRALAGDAFIDIRLWKEIFPVNIVRRRKPVINGIITENEKGVLYDDGPENCIYVGFKGMPGRRGIGSGHKGVGRIDPKFQTLRRWIGNENDFNTYAQFFKK